MVNKFKNMNSCSFSKIRSAIVNFHKDEEGDEAVELAVLFPIILLLVGFIIDRFIQYEGVTSISSAANEALRYAIIEESPEKATAVIKETLSDRLESNKLAWCTGNENSSCRLWKENIKSTQDINTFKNNKNMNLLVHVDRKGWCNGSYLKLGVRAHKSSIFPSYESFQHLLKNGGPVYHQHSYIITARIESNTKCD